MGRRDRIVPIFGRDFQAFLVDHDFDVAVGRPAGRCAFWNVAQSVLITRLGSDLSVGLFNPIARKFGNYLSAPGGRGVLGEQVEVALTFEMKFSNLAEYGQGAAADDNRFYLNIAGLQHLQDVAVAGLTAELLAVTDDQNHLPSCAVALAQ